jgi:hypothetical protein
MYSIRCSSSALSILREDDERAQSFEASGSKAICLLAVDESCNERGMVKHLNVPIVKVLDSPMDHVDRFSQPDRSGSVFV